MPTTFVHDDAQGYFVSVIEERLLRLGTRMLRKQIYKEVKPARTGENQDVKGKKGKGGKGGKDGKDKQPEGLDQGGGTGDTGGGAASPPSGLTPPYTPVGVLPPANLNKKSPLGST